MPERIIEIIVYAMRRFQDDKKSSEKLDLTSELTSKGYTESEINLSFSWIYDHLKKSSADKRSLLDADLIEDIDFNNNENPILSDEAYGYLIQMIQLGILSEYQVDQILEKALISGDEYINTEKVKSFVVNILFDSEKFNSAFSSFYFNRGNEQLQ
jgi:Smg protein